MHVDSFFEPLSFQKRRAVWRLAGDIRGEGASIMLTLWQALGWGEHSSTAGEPTMRFGVSTNSVPVFDILMNFFVGLSSLLEYFGWQCCFVMLESS